jgi:hypothetical protein
MFLFTGVILVAIVFGLIYIPDPQKRAEEHVEEEERNEKEEANELKSYEEDTNA